MKNFTTTKSAAIREIQSVMVNTLFVFSMLMLLNMSAYARGAPESFADLAEELSPSVVNITTSTTIAGVTDQARPQIPEGSPFEDLFKDFFNNGEGPSVISSFVIDSRLKTSASTFG